MVGTPASLHKVNLTPLLMPSWELLGWDSSSQQLFRSPQPRPFLLWSDGTGVLAGGHGLRILHALLAWGGALGAGRGFRYKPTSVTCKLPASLRETATRL